MAEQEDPNSHIAQTQKTYSQIHAEYADQNTKLRSEIQQLLDRFIEIMPGKDVLDIGCATGRESKYLLDHGFNVTGTDITEEFIEVARRACPSGKFFVADMRNLDLPDESFDGLWVNASFLHIPKADADTTLEGFHRVLRAGGVAFISVMKGDFDDLRPNVSNNWPDRHFSDYQEDELELKLNKSGFTPIEFSAEETSWGPTFLRYFVKKTRRL
ncbi:MAG TPA: class I SAM-dependent methyltransferase [Candidatus Saccharimonadia bacterium]|jgi:ubiquinone/menaquinone biosynthesis C-methylase UbiE